MNIKILKHFLVTVKRTKLSNYHNISLNCIQNTWFSCKTLLIILLHVWLPLPTCSVWRCGTCGTKASSYLWSGRMTEVIRLALYTEVLGPWECDCAGGRLPSTDTGLADVLPLGILNISALSTISSYGSISIYLSSIVTNEDKTWYISFYLLLANSMTAFNNQQYRRFPSIFGVEYGVGNWIYVSSPNSEIRVLLSHTSVD